MEKTVRIGTVPAGNRRASMFCKIELLEGNLSISGVIGPLPSGNALGGCGQICREFKHRNSKTDDPRYSHLITATEINFARGWGAKLWLDFLDIWEQYHLNDMQPACEHQRALGWKYEEHHDPKTFKGDPCPTCGYEIGSKWLRIEVPPEAIKFLEELPDADKQPAWV